MRRRNVTNELLKEYIADALIHLMKEKSLETITITEITDLADVGRVTYYRNFSSKEDVLSYKIDLLLGRWMEEAELAQGLYDIAVQFMYFILSMKDFLNVLYQNHLFHLLLICFYKIMGPKEGDSSTLVFKKAFQTFGIFGVINEWVKNGMVETPEELGDILAVKLLESDGTE